MGQAILGCERSAMTWAWLDFSQNSVIIQLRLTCHPIRLHAESALSRGGFGVYPRVHELHQAKGLAKHQASITCTVPASDNSPASSLTTQLDLQVAYGEDGSPSKALQGFCRKNGVDPKAATVEGDYVWAEVQAGGQSSLEVRAAVRAMTCE